MTTWKKEIEKVANGEEIIACTLSEEELQVRFDDGHGGSEGKAFTAWSERHVFFPVVYDGAEWVAKAPRNPCDKATGHVGGE